jgi:hypothetical protein
MSAAKVAQSRTLTTPEAARAQWSRRRMLYTAGALFVLEIAAVLLLAERSTIRMKPAEQRTVLTLAADEASLRHYAEVPALSDPTLLALPSVKGFSGGAWLNFPALDYRPRDWNEPPQWLELEAKNLTQTFEAFMGVNTRRPLLVADRPTSRSTAYNLEVSTDPVSVASTVDVEGELASRSLLNRWSLPSWPRSDLLSNNVVQVVVNGAGEVVAATLLPENGESGSPQADQLALNLAKAARFAPLQDATAMRQPNHRLSWGRIVFRWHTVPPATSTNTPAGAP